MRAIFIHLRRSIKLMCILAAALVLIVGIVYFVFKPVYAVKLNGEIIGYTDAKKQLEEQIDKFMKKGDGDKIAFVEIDTMPEYEICYSKSGIEINEEKIFDTVIASGTAYYKNYAILVDNEEKAYVSTPEEAEKIIADLKEKKSQNADQITYITKYSSDDLEESTADKVVADLYVEPPPVITYTPKKTYTPTGSVNTSQTVSYAVQPIGVSFIRPVSGTITSRFGRRSRGTHTGLDIATSRGTPIVAAAGGTVTFAGPKGSYGNLVVVDHGNGVQTYYAHCNTINCRAGQVVSQGQQISTIGSTGNSTGPHLHLEIRINGICQNPQNYLY